MLSPITSVLLLTLAIFSYASHNHTEVGCKHDEVEFNPEFFKIDEDISITEGRRLSSSYPNLRIYPYYEFLNSAPSSYQEYIQKELAPPVLAYFQEALDVKYPIKTLLKLESTTKKICGRDIPNVLSTGVKADYFMIFDSVSDTGSWVAESTNCGLAADTKRPIVSTTLFNRQLFKEADGNVLLHEKNIYLLLHEMTHTFGFSKNLYKYYLDDNGVTRKGHTKELRLSGKTSIVVDVPSLTNRLRSFFGCSSLAGAYMENSGSSATMGSHFERRQFGYEAMTSGLIYQQSY